MTTPASPPITMAQVRAEFGGTAGVTKLSAYVRGGAYVPNTGTNAGVPTSVPITLSQLCGASSVVFSASASPTSVYGSRITPGTATSSSSTATPSGAGGSVTYLWQYVSGDAAIAANTSTSSTTTWSVTVNGANPSRTAVWRCKVTDSVYGITYTNNVTVTLEYAP
jgi:hypothetical protein